MFAKFLDFMPVLVSENHMLCFATVTEWKLKFFGTSESPETKYKL